MPTMDEYLGEVYRVIRENFPSTDPTGSMTAAAAGYLVKLSVAPDHTQFGFLKFKDVLQRLERQGLIRIGANSKNALSIWLIEQTGQPTPVSTRPPIGRSFRPLRKAVWHAFTAARPAGRRFLNRATGEVKLEVQNGLETDPSWVEIVPLDYDSDRNVALDFLKENSLDNAELMISLDSDRWYVDFTRALSAYSPGLATDWKRYRSHHVIGIVKEWCRKNRVDTAIVFEEFPPKQSFPTVQPTGSGHDQLKALLLAALEHMSADELMELRLPARHLVAVLRPDLLG